MPVPAHRALGWARRLRAEPAAVLAHAVGTRGGERALTRSPRAPAPSQPRGPPSASNPRNPARPGGQPVEVTGWVFKQGHQLCQERSQVPCEGPPEGEAG